MNNGILGAQPFSIGIDSVGIKPLLGAPTTMPVSYYRPPNNYWRVASDDGTSSEDYVIVIDTTKGSSTTIGFNILGQLGGSYDIDWGDGTHGVYIVPGNTNVSRVGSFETRIQIVGTTNFTGSHTYACHGIYVISIKGVFGTTAATVSAPVVSPVATVISVLNYGSNNNKISTLNLYSAATNLISVPKNIPTGITNLIAAFANCTNFNSPNIVYWNTSRVTNLQATFNNAANFDQDISNWDVSNVTTLVQTFTNAVKFNQNIGKWNISKVTNFQQIFSSNSTNTARFNQDLSAWGGILNPATTNLNSFMYNTNSFNNNGQPLTNWNIPSGCDCTNMFRNASLNNIDMSGWTFGGNVNANFMFGGVAPANLDTWNSAVTGISNMNNMFANSFAAATGLKIENWDVSNVTGMNSMLSNATINQDLSKWNVSKVTDFNGFLLNAGGNRNLSGWNIASGCNCTSMFQFNSSLTSGYYGDWTFNGNNINCTTMFSNSSTFQGNGLNTWNTSGIANMSNMFQNCGALRISGLNNWNVSNVTNMASMFEACSPLGSGDLSNWDTSKCTNFSRMFFTNSATATRDINLSNWKIQGNISNMFSIGGGTVVYNVSGWIFTGAVTNSTSLFRQGTIRDIKYIGYSSWNSGMSNITSLNSWFPYYAYPIENLSSWDVSNVTDFNSFAYSASGFSNNGVSLSGWNTSKAKNMGLMFYKLFNGGNFNGNVSNWDVSNVTDMNGMFYGQSGFNQDLSGWNTGQVTNMSQMFSGDSNTGAYGPANGFTGSGISTWNVTGVTNATSMFAYNVAFKASLTGWNLCNCTSLTNFMLGCNIGSDNYDALLNAWSVTITGNPVKNWSTTLTPHFGTTKYTSAGSGARQKLINYGWTITDGGLQT